MQGRVEKIGQGQDAGRPAVDVPPGELVQRNRGRAKDRRLDEHERPGVLADGIEGQQRIGEELGVIAEMAAPWPFPRRRLEERAPVQHVPQQAVVDAGVIARAKRVVEAVGVVPEIADVEDRADQYQDGRQRIRRPRHRQDQLPTKPPPWRQDFGLPGKRPGPQRRDDGSPRGHTEQHDQGQERKVTPFPHLAAKEQCEEPGQAQRSQSPRRVVELCGHVRRGKMGEEVKPAGQDRRDAAPEDGDEQVLPKVARQVVLLEVVDQPHRRDGHADHETDGHATRQEQAKGAHRVRQPGLEITVSRGRHV